MGAEEFGCTRKTPAYGVCGHAHDKPPPHGCFDRVVLPADRQRRARVFAQDIVEPAPLPSDRVFSQLFVVAAEAPQPARVSLLESAAAAPVESREETPAVKSAPPRPLFASLYAGLIAAQALDVHSTLRALDAGHAEANPATRWATGNTATFVAFKAAATAGTIYLTERVRKKHPKGAVVILATIDSLYAFVVAHNYRAPVSPR